MTETSGMKFIHAADIHLDSPLRGLARYDGAPVEAIRGATRLALQNLVDLAVDEGVDFVLIAGDVYDGDWKDHNTGLFFVSQMTRLREAGIPVVMISGNHDAANRMTKTLRLPDNVTRLSHRKPETAASEQLRDLGVAIHGQSFAQPAELQNLAAAYPAQVSGMFNIGILHTSLTGAEGHEPYAPCSLDDLRNKGYDYWALGHVHTREVKCDDPCIVYPGNIQGRHIREEGARGCYLVTVDSTGQCDLEFRTLDVMRWNQLTVDVSGAKSDDDVLDLCSEHLSELMAANQELPTAVRVVMVGNTDLHGQLIAQQEHWMNQVRAIAIDTTGGQVWIEKVCLSTSPLASSRLDFADDGPIAALVQYVEELQKTPEALTEVSDGLCELQKKLPDEILRGVDGLPLRDIQYLSSVMEDVKELLVQKLSEGPVE